MRINKFFMGLGAVAALSLAACSNDEPVNNQPAQDGETAYMKVSIKSATGLSRYTTTPGYEDGNEDEHAVNSVRFYFFDKTGASMDLTAYLAKGDGTISVNPDENVNDNVEAVFGDNLLVLEKLTGNEYPSYMITVLNRPDFVCGPNLNATLEALDNCKNGSYFVMSTASYKGENTHHDNTYYHATKLVPDDFQKSAEAAVANGNTVSIYVERLAAKVQLDLNSEMKSETKVVNGETLYKLEQTVAGGNNTENVDGSNQLGTELYIRVLGWDLNTTAKESYMCKNIDTEWSLDWGDNGSWNSSDAFRSYWAKSYIYGNTLAAATGKLAYVKTGNWTEGENKTLVALNGVKYCNENTNTAENVQTDGLVDSRIVTNAVLYTQVCDENGNEVELVKANGVLFTANSYKQYIINRAYAMNPATLNIYMLTSSSSSETEGEDGTVTGTTNTYVQIGTEYFDLVKPEGNDYAGIGDVDVVVLSDKFTGTYYKKDGNNFVEMSQEEVTAAIAALEEAIANAQPSSENHAVMYGHGKSVYYIPVEHLGNLKGKEEIVEASYGVVRNHWYKLTVSSFSKVGHGIWDPEDGEEYSEELIPNEPEDPLYYLGADINILAWKVVEQEVEL